MSFIEDNSLVNDFMFAPPKSSYGNGPNIAWINNVCCVFVMDEGGDKTSLLNKNSTIESKFVIILCHGNACDIGHMVNFARKLSSVCSVHVVLYEYPGYGLSKGHPSENSCVQGLKDVINHLNIKMKIPIGNMIFYGQSIGSGIATVGYKYCKVELKQSPSGLILISPYLSIESLKNDIMPSCSSIPILERLNTQENIKECDTGLLIIHGTNDHVIPVKHGNELSKIAKCPINILDIVLGASHNDLSETRIIAKCEILLNSIINLRIYKSVKYYNIIEWDYKNCENHKGVPNMATKVAATTLESSMACTKKVSSRSSDCVLF